MRPRAGVGYSYRRDSPVEFRGLHASRRKTRIPLTADEAAVRRPAANPESFCSAPIALQYCARLIAKVSVRDFRGSSWAAAATPRIGKRGWPDDA